MATTKLAVTTMPVDNLIATAFEQVKQLGAAEEASRLFPEGLESLELDFEAGNGARISLRFKARQSGSTASITGAVDDDGILTEDGVHASFNAEGHHVIALIATTDLQQRLPNTMKKVQKVLDKGGRDLLSAAVFPDVIRDKQPATKPFHFVDIELETGGPANPPMPPAPHVVSKIPEFTATLKHGGSAQQMVDALSWLIHLYGDVHQPLHCVTHITATHPRPDGDRGGNSFALKGSPKNLHALWDSVVDFTSQPELVTSQSIMQEHTRASLAAELAVTDIEKWARASFSLAKQSAYGPLQENPAAPPKPSAAYLAAANKIGRRQAALAGYRLANALQAIFG
ncbi:MAG: S1/P1 nuclease [Candidatus Solibacter sp.]